MNKITQAFVNKKALTAFLTGGDPNIETTEKLIVAMAESGVDMIEIGIPFSDPMAETLVVQTADERALTNGCTVDKLFAMVKRARRNVDIPLLFMTYINPIFAYGTERFMKNCQDCGIDGVIVPDLPFEERGELADACKQYGITHISLIAPSSQERVQTIARQAEGFLYCVSSLGQADSDAAQMIVQAKAVADLPCAIAVNTSEQARKMAAIVDGVMIGSGIVQLVAEHGKDAITPVTDYIREMEDALR
ncbi:MAG: tryptophan synthase subunit alpha [Oscillospiraceae bacterium]|nr:tryptophan synthase subunit alpha [Oscillospiraceae bacterium]